MPLLSLVGLRQDSERKRAVPHVSLRCCPRGHAIAAICARLDGLPLALELAAPRTAALSPQVVLARLDHRLALLTAGSREAPERQRSLRATLDWSYDLLTAPARALLARLAVFAGGWTVDAAEAVCARFAGPTLDVVDGLQTLITDGLVQRQGREGELRFTMLETIREYALERLAKRGEMQAARQAQAAYVLALAERAAPALHGPEQGAWLDRLDEDQANLRVALAWLLEEAPPDARRLAWTLHWYWRVRGRLREGR